MAQCPVCNNELADGENVCPACGYKTIESTQGFTPVQVGSDEFASVAKAPHTAFLKIVRGPQTGLELSLRPGVFMLGREPNCEIFLNDMTVSRTHAKITVLDDKTIIEDQNSFNGVWVNNKNVATRVLVDGDVIQLGAFCLLYQER
jgi:hypothetical protein